MDTSRKIYCLFTFVGIMIMVFGSSEARAETEKAAESAITKIRGSEGWSYHVGDFELDEQGRPAGIHNEAVWKPYESDQDVKKRSHTVMWLTRRLPEQAVPNPAIFVPTYTIYDSFDVYLEDRLVFTFGRSYSPLRLRHVYLKWHLIPLPPDCSGKRLSFRFYAEDPQNTGRFGTIYLGERNTLFTHFLLRDIDVTILGILFIIIGLFGYLFLGKIYQWRNAAFLSFATLATFSGIYLLTAESKLTQLVIESIVALSYLDYLSYFLFMAGMWGFLASTPWLGLKWMSRLLWQLHVACAAGSIVLDILGLVSLETLFDGSFMLVGITMLVIVAEMVRAVRRETQEAKILGFGLGIFALASFYDVLVGLHILPASRVIYPWGQCVFLLSQAYLLALRYQSEISALQAEVLRSARLASLGELAAGVAHEVNNPITGIIGCAEFLAGEYEGQETSSEMLDIIIQEGHRIAKITGNLLSFSRKQQHVLKPVQMQEVIADALALTAKLFQKSHITVRLDIPDQLPTVMADRQQLQQVLINLLNNARYALDQTNKEQQKENIVDIQCTTILFQDCHYVRTSVYDNGSGIPEDMLDKICDPFYTSKPRGEGTGLGLSISYGIIEAHNGRLSFESQEGSYTKAIIDLPVITEG